MQDLAQIMRINKVGKHDIITIGGLSARDR
jgi:hypothetical protein